MSKVKRPNQYPPALTRANQKRFLEALVACGGNAKRACGLIGIAETRPWHWAQSSAEFSKKMQSARALGEKALLAEYEDRVDKRSEAGKDDPQSAVLTMFRMKRLDPAYRDNAQVNIATQGPALLVFEVLQGNTTNDSGQALLEEK